MDYCRKTLKRARLGKQSNCIERICPLKGRELYYCTLNSFMRKRWILLKVEKRKANQARSIQHGDLLGWSVFVSDAVVSMFIPTTSNHFILACLLVLILF